MAYISATGFAGSYAGREARPGRAQHGANLLESGPCTQSPGEQVMPRATDCVARITVAQALELRDSGIQFLCSECNQPVRPHKAGGDIMEAHFEHLARNHDCSLSDPPR